LYDAVQEYSPDTEVVLGGFMTMSLRFLAGCNGLVSSFYDDDGNLYDQTFFDSYCLDEIVTDVVARVDSVLKFAKYDILDIHLYDDAEQWDEYFYNFSDTISKPIIVTEFGGPNVNIEPYSEAYQSERLFQYISVLDDLPISEAYYFKLVEGSNNPAHVKSGLIASSTLIEKEAYYLFASFIACSTKLNSHFHGNISFYPNPMTDKTTLQLGDIGNFEDVSIVIVNSLGQVVIEYYENIHDNFVIDKLDLNYGLYTVIVRNDIEILAKGKLIVN
jgi:hypothetical protein